MKISQTKERLIINGIPINHEKPSFELGSEVSGDKLRDSLLLTSNFSNWIFNNFISASKYSILKHVLFSPRSESLLVLIAYFTFVITDCLNEISLLTKDTMLNGINMFDPARTAIEVRCHLLLSKMICGPVFFFSSIIIIIIITLSLLLFSLLRSHNYF